MVNAFVVEPEFEAALDAELGETTTRTPRWPALLTRPLDHATPHDPLFARQVLPEAQLVKTADAAALPEAICDCVVARLGANAAVAGVFVFSPDAEKYRSLKPHVAAVEQALKRRLQHNQIVRATGAAPAGAVAVQRAWRSQAHAVQVAIVGRSSALVSCAVPTALTLGGFQVAPWAAGIAPVATDKQAPSRAYRKLEEAFAWMGRAPRAGERVVDLGGAPGGWAWMALKRGAQVTAVDRAPLTPPAAGHPNLVQIQGDAFAFAPPAPVDWLLCDVICEPHRSIALIERWASLLWCQHLVVTVKFKGERDNHLVVSPVVPRLRELGFSFARAKHLHHNHNEVEVMATRLAL